MKCLSARRLFLHRHITHLRARRIGGELAQDRKRIGRGVELAGLFHDFSAILAECGLVDDLAAETSDHAFAVADVEDAVGVMTLIHEMRLDQKASGPERMDSGRVLVFWLS